MSNKQPTNTQLIAIDPGNGAVKLFGAQRDFQMPSQVAVNGIARMTTMAGLRQSEPPLHIQLHTGQSFFVGKGAHKWGRGVEAFDYDRATGIEFRALLLGALTRYHVAENAPLRVMVGLSVETLSGERGSERKRALMRALEGTHHWTADGAAHRIEIAEARCTTQAVGALFDFVLDDNLKSNPAAKPFLRGEVGIVSVGFRDVDVMAIQNLEPVPVFTGGKPCGVKWLLESETLNPGGAYSLAEMDERLRAKRLDYTPALNEWTREVVGFIHSKWGEQWKRFGTVLIVGGGAVLLRDPLLRHFQGKAQIAAEPVYAIAHGLWKLAARDASH